MKKKYLSWLPAILMMLVIFSFSSKPASVSGENSLRIADYVMTLYEKITDSYVEELRYDRLLTLDHCIRKGAHVTEYAILSAAICLPLWIRRLKGRKLWLLAVLITAAYAASDEFHQRFVPGRSGEFKDVMIDTSGAALGAFLFLLAAATVQRFKNRRHRTETTSE